MLDGLRHIASKEPAHSAVFKACEAIVLGEHSEADDMLAKVPAIGERRLKDWRLAEAGAGFWMPPLAERRAPACTDLGAEVFFGSA